MTSAMIQSAILQFENKKADKIKKKGILLDLKDNDGKDQIKGPLCINWWFRAIMIYIS